ncbi:hypothetical protein [Thermus tenuipuniceus]|uniref:hypothetical protein n=1 Tax=Thermus tenuipuniceus TaxID=2078690 RepID=UPI0013E36CB7|nr:hypothetical protein [Thermus tenuipuniceus]
MFPVVCAKPALPDWGVAQDPAIGRVSALGLVRPLTKPKAMEGKPLSLGEA